MLRKGRFVLWNNKEFEIVSYWKEYYLKSNNPGDLQWGFQEMSGNPQVFFKPVRLEDLEDAFEIIPYVIVSGYRFAIEGYDMKTGMLTLVTNNPFVKNKIPVRPYGKFEYIIEVSIDGLEIKEDRVPILGFESLSP